MSARCSECQGDDNSFDSLKVARCVVTYEITRNDGLTNEILNVANYYLAETAVMGTGLG